MATPFLLALRSRIPDRDIHLLCRSYVAALFERHPAVDNLVTYERSKGVWGAIDAIRKGVPREGRDLCFVLPRSFSSALAAFVSGAVRRIGYGGDMRGALLTDALPREQYHEGHLSEAYLRLLDVVAPKSADEPAAPVVVPPYDWQQRLSRLGRDHGYVVVSPGAEYGSAKIWPKERFAELVKRVASETGKEILVIGSAREKARAEEIVSSAGVRAINLAGSGDTEQLLCIVRGASLLIGNDSGPVHISAAMGRPTVTIFGSTDPSWTAPIGMRTAIVSAGLDCAPCFERECPRGEAECMLDIDVDRVLDAARRMLREGEIE